MLRGIGVAIGLIVLIAWDHPKGLTVLITALVVLAYLAIVELVGRSARTAPSVDAAA